ncbi:MAG TPA: hypothetical protein VFW64_03515 [Pseudonocardiaceae bacterium]|nr:hypothetical protein [Pseudonocardiaceae bacterium]
MVLNHAPAGQLLVRLQDAKNGKYFGEQKVVNAGKTTSILVSDVLAGTQFHVYAASPIGSPGGLVSRSVTDGEAHGRRKESPVSSLRVDLITDHRRSLRPDGLKPC